MEIEPVAWRSTPVPPQRTGVTAELAEARAQLRALAPSDRLDHVQAEVRRLQAREGLSPLAAVRAVLAKLAAGWLPG
jgi:hypothetical protein